MAAGNGANSRTVKIAPKVARISARAMAAEDGAIGKEGGGVTSLLEGNMVYVRHMGPGLQKVKEALGHDCFVGSWPAPTTTHCRPLVLVLHQGLSVGLESPLKDDNSFHLRCSFLRR